MQLDFTKEEIIDMYHNMNVRDWAKALGITVYKATQLTKQLGLKKSSGPKTKPFIFKEPKESEEKISLQKYYIITFKYDYDKEKTLTTYDGFSEELKYAKRFSTLRKAKEYLLKEEFKNEFEKVFGRVYTQILIHLVIVVFETDENQIKYAINSKHEIIEIIHKGNEYEK